MTWDFLGERVGPWGMLVSMPGRHQIIPTSDDTLRSMLAQNLLTGRALAYALTLSP